MVTTRIKKVRLNRTLFSPSGGTTWCNVPSGGLASAQTVLVISSKGFWGRYECVKTRMKLNINWLTRIS